MRTLLFLVLIIFSISFLANGQPYKNVYITKRITNPPKIDGVLDDEVWDVNSEKYYFKQQEPNNGADASYPTQVQMYYNDQALYIMARMHDPAPESIPKEFGLRDDDGRNADRFGIVLDTYNKGQNAFLFTVSAAGVQIDINASADNADYNWNAVWKSAVTIDEQGWVVEIEIPYFALRFPKQEIQTWGVNFFRNIQSKRERSYWNFVDKSVQGFINQAGTLEGIVGVEPPLRLSLLPYMSVVHTIDDASGISETSLNGGLDLKYGINESFTLDMSLIPDFSQVRLDDQVLNLSAFEVQFDENRSFFTEGTELFNRNGLFYSRRVGQSRGSVQTITDYDSIVSRPGAAPLINATKVSGRTKKGTGIGFFNAVTNKSYAEIATPADLNGEYTEDADGNRRYKEYKIVETPYDDHVSNYNVLVVDQNLKNNSNIALINTNVTRSNAGDNANVTGTDFKLFDKTNTWRISGFAAISNVDSYLSDSVITVVDGVLADTVTQNYYRRDTGYKYTLFFGKVSGKWQYNIYRNVVSDKYNINDMGYLQNANEIYHGGEVIYNIFNPVWKLNNFWARLGWYNGELYKPQKRTELGMETNVSAQLKNFWTIGGGQCRNLGKSAQYFYRSISPDEVGLDLPESNWVNAWVESDSRKSLFISIFKGRWKRKDWNQHDHWHGAYVRYRVSNRLSFTHDFEYNREYNSIGYVWMSDDVRSENGLDDVRVFGHRNIKRMNSILGVNYVFNNKMGIDLRVRHNWTRVRYYAFEELESDGKLHALLYEGIDSEGNPNHDQNFNAFNMNMTFSWQIAPGSFLTAVWREGINTETNNVSRDYFENLDDMFKAPQFNSFSIRVTYFLDYLTVKNSLRSTRS